MSGLPVHREGWLWKVGGSIQTWKKRWMVLQGKTLSYFKSDKDSSAQGTIDLDGASVTALLHNNEYSSSTTTHNTALFGITPSQSSRMYVIQASSEAERDAWIADCASAGAFKITLTPLSSKTQPDSFLEGWMDKQSSARFGIFGGSTERVYACLFWDKLAMWKNVQTSSAPVDQIPLNSESVLISGKITGPFELVSKKGEPKWVLTPDTASQKSEWLNAIQCVIKGQKYAHPAYEGNRGSLITQSARATIAALSAGTDNRHSMSMSSTSLPLPPLPPLPSSASPPSSPSPVTPVTRPASQSFSEATPPTTKLKRNSVVGMRDKPHNSDNDSDDDIPPPPSKNQLSHATSHDGHDEDDSGDDDEPLDEATAKNANIAEAVDFSDIPPPPAMDEDGIIPPPPPSSELDVAVDDGLLTKQPDVLLQLNALLTSRFGGDISAMQNYLNSFMKEKLTAPPSSDVTPVTNSQPLSSKLSKMLVSGGSTKATRMLHVHLLEARDLPAMDSNGFSDPYVVMHIRGSSHKKKDALSSSIKSKTILETLDPIWDQQLTLDLKPGAEELIVDVYDFDKFSTDDFIGRAVIPLHTLTKHHSGLSGWCTLGGIKDDWNCVGAVFLGAVVDEHFVDESSRNGNAGFLHSRAQCLLAQEQRYFASQLGIPISPSSASSTASTAVVPQEKLKVFVGSWNAGNAAPPDDLSEFIPLYTADIYVIGTQECEYAPRRDCKTCKVDWQCVLVRHFGRDYTLIKYQSLWEIRIAVFVLNRHLPNLTNIQSFHEATGIGNVLGNKGGAVVALQYKSLKLCFVNSHLAAHQNTCELRNQNYRTICKNVRVGPLGQSDIINEFHHVIWNGDLNYRLDYGNQGAAHSPSQQLFDEMVQKIESGSEKELQDLWKVDQLTREMKNQKAFIGFKEGEYNFAPTFKVKRNDRLEYTSQRSPAWCDRILTRSVPGFPLEQLSLGMVRGMDTSDHKPVVSMFEVSVPPSFSPLDRTLGEAVIRLHDLRCTNLRAPKEKEQDASQIANAKDLDPQLIFLASFLPHPIVTPVVKKNVHPQFLELPPSPSTYNEIRRLRQTPIYVRVINHQSQDAIVGRAIISLHDLAPIEPAATGKGDPQTMRFEVDFTYAGMPAGSLTGQVSLMFKPKAKK